MPARVGMRATLTPYHPTYAPFTPSHPTTYHPTYALFTPLPTLAPSPLPPPMQGRAQPHNSAATFTVASVCGQAQVTLADPFTFAASAFPMHLPTAAAAGGGYPADPPAAASRDDGPVDHEALAAAAATATAATAATSAATGPVDPEAHAVAAACAAAATAAAAPAAAAATPAAATAGPEAELGTTREGLLPFTSCRMLVRCLAGKGRG